MYRVGLLILCLIVMVAYGSTWVGADQSPESVSELCIPMGIIALQPPSGADQQRAAVDFNHSLHFDFNCKTCHHTWEGTGAVQSCSTSGCHDLVKTPMKPDNAGIDEEMAIRNFKRAFHASCIGCHKRIKEANLALEMSRKPVGDKLAATGPTSCAECHPRD
jgi:hypothetical protein